MKVRIFGTLVLGLITIALIAFGTTSQASLSSDEGQAAISSKAASTTTNGDAQQSEEHARISFPHIPY